MFILSYELNFYTFKNVQLLCRLYESILDFKFSPYSEYSVFSFGLFPGVSNCDAGELPKRKHTTYFNVKCPFINCVEEFGKNKIIKFRHMKDFKYFERPLIKHIFQ